MVRVTLIEEPGDDDALKAVRAKLSNAIVEVVSVVHDSDPSGVAGKADIISALERIESQLGPGSLESLDLVGHGAPGTIRVGATAAKSNKVRTSDQTEDWAMLDSDVNKLEALVSAAERLRAWRQGGLLAPGFQVRLIGCNTAVDPGIVPDALLPTLQDGAAFIHLLASFFDCEVAGTLGYLGPEAFDATAFKATELLRTCVCGSQNGVVTFNPASVAGGMSPDTKVGSLGVKGVTVKADPQLKALLLHYQADAVELKTKQPLVIKDESIPVDGVSVDLVEEGKAVLIKSGGKLYRAKARPDRIAHAQQATLEYLARPGGAGADRAPLWANRSTPYRPIEPKRGRINRVRRPAPTAVP